jgi:hypothetical protein
MLRTEAKQAQKADRSLLGFFPLDEVDGLSSWTTDQLLEEVLRRSAHDLGAMERMRHMMLRASLTAIDRALAPDREA